MHIAIIRHLLRSLAALALLALPAFSGNTHVVGIGVCPPWKGVPPAFCEQAVRQMTGALAQRYDVPAGNVHTILNEKATVAGVTAFLNGLSTLNEEDRVILYTVMHNGSGKAGQAATASDDVMIFWSETDPGVIEFALAEGKWMLGSDFAAALQGLGMGELIAILDACQSGAVGLEVLHRKGTSMRVATVASARAGQLANLTQDLSAPLFSSTLLAAMSASTAPLPKLLKDVSSQVARKARPLCTERRAQMAQNNGFVPDCNQTPIVRDPSALLNAL